MFRSITVVPCDLYMQTVVAFETVVELGKLNCVHFVNVNTDPKTKSYTPDINRCIKLEKKLEYIEYQMLKEDKVTIHDPDENPQPIRTSEMVMFENMVEKWENDIRETTENLSDLENDLLELKEMDRIMKDAGPMMEEAKPDMNEMIIKFKEEENDALFHGTMYLITGVIDRTVSHQCQMLLWRISRGNIHYRAADHDFAFDNPETGLRQRKVAFLAVCQGEELRSRTEKVLKAFKATIHPCPTNAQERSELIDIAENHIRELEDVLIRSKFYRCMVLRAVSKLWRGWLIQVRKTKAIYYHMNMMKLDLPKNCLIARCWIAEKDIAKVETAMHKCTITEDNSLKIYAFEDQRRRDLDAKREKLKNRPPANISSHAAPVLELSPLKLDLMGLRVPSVLTRVEGYKAIPPTLQQTTKFSYAPQVLVNAYGHAKYKEINPGLFLTIGLPLLFSIMFADMGHAIILIVIALWMICSEKQLKEKRGNEFWDVLFGGRYLLLLMGCFSFYSGLCANHLFTKSINMSASMYKNSIPEGSLLQNTHFVLGAKGRLNKQYVWGTDPMWQLSKNRIQMKSSYLMKMSLIIGTYHLLFGMILGACNHMYFKNNFAIYLQTLPQMLFLISLFGWLVMLIYLKWWLYMDGHPNVNRTAECAPPILPHFLSRFIPVEITLPEKCTTPYFFDLQPVVQNILNLIVILSILVLLFGTPMYIYLYNKKVQAKLSREMKIVRYRHKKGCKLACDDPCEEMCEVVCGEQEQKWLEIIERHSTPMSLLLTNQLLFTIDFVFGLVAHFASYLRLWALGLGHLLIADMFWVMILRTMALRVFEDIGAAYLVLAFAAFAILTFIVLICVEASCCFLHALRLHWVEFMSKFYIDEGKPFRPFNLGNISSVTYTKITDARFQKKMCRLHKKGKTLQCREKTTKV